MNSQKRLLLTLKYLWNKTDEEHPATLKDIGEYLQQNSIETTRKTLQADIHLLTEFGIDVICNHSTQNQYHRRLHNRFQNFYYREFFQLQLLPHAVFQPCIRRDRISFVLTA